MIKIKICGITKIEDALYAAELGAWAVGFIFVKNSPRYIEPVKASEIIKELPENIEKVGVFANLSYEEIKNTAITTGITAIQLHGDESAEFCSDLLKLNIKIIKAIRIKDNTDLDMIKDYKEIISAILLDTYSDTEYGGTGKSFNWDIILNSKEHNLPLILAGGINLSNIDKATKLEPYAIDISSGVEKDKGIKDHQKMKNIFAKL